MTTHGKTVAALLCGIALSSTPARALDLGLDLGGLGEVGVSVGDDGISAGADVGGAVSVDAGVGSGGVDAGVSASGIVDADASVGQGGVSVDTSVAGGAVDAGASVGAGGVSVDASAGGGAVSAGVSAGPSGVTVGVSAAPPQAPNPSPSPAPSPVPGPVPSAPQPVPGPGAQPPAPAHPAVPQPAPGASAPAPQTASAPVSRTRTTSGDTKITAVPASRRADAVLDLLEDSGLSGTDLDRAVDDRRIVIVYLDELLDQAARDRIYTAIRRGAAGYREVSAAVAGSRKVAEVLRRNRIDLDDVVAIQVGVDGTTEILVSERARVVMASDDIPLVWDMFANSYFPVGAADLPVWRPVAWNPGLASPLVTRTLRTADAGSPDQAETAPAARATLVARRQDTASACGPVQGPPDIDLIATRLWEMSTPRSRTVIPGWDMNGVALHALFAGDDARLDAVMAVTGAPDPIASDLAAPDPLARLDRFETVFDPGSAEWADMTISTHAALQQVDLGEVAATEQVVVDFAPPEQSLSLAAVADGPAPDCSPTTIDTLRVMGPDLVADLG